MSTYFYFPVTVHGDNGLNISTIAPFVTALPVNQRVETEVVVLIQQLGTMSKGLYVFHNDAWRYVMSMINVAQSIVRGDLWDVYLNTTGTMTPASTATVYRNGYIQAAASSYPADPAHIYATRTPGSLLTSGGIMTGNITMTNGAQLEGLSGPFDLTAAVNRQYVDFPATKTLDSSKITSYNVSTSDFTLRFDCTVATITALLPDATTCGGKLYYCKRLDNNANTSAKLQSVTGQWIDGYQSFVITDQFGTTLLQSNGVNWDVLATF